jgi:probable HAF family extracellular repeat protein
MTDLGAGCAYGINDAGQVVGQNGSGHAFLYSDGTMTDLGAGCAYGINDAGQVVGQNGSGYAFLYSDGTMTDLNSLIDPASGWILEYANAVNDKGQIAGYGWNSASGQTDAILLTPTPEPATLVLLAAGAATLVARRRRD